MTKRSHPVAAPETWIPAQRVARRLLGPLERFLHIEAASGVLLLVASAVALLWANSPWWATYAHVWHAPVTLGLGEARIVQPVHFWINDVLMVVFFFVAGLEIRREIHEGELSEPRRAALPVAAALGGMIAPALIYLAIGGSGVGRPGWGIPTATDIAFAVGVLALLGKRVPPALRVLLLALAIIDDIGAILVIALFYSSGVEWVWLAVSSLGVGAVFLLQRVGVRRATIYVLPGFVVWFGLLRAGVHPTIAGVILGLMTPVRPWFGARGFMEVARGVLQELRAKVDRPGLGEHDLIPALGEIRRANREAVSPIVRLQTALHPWVAFVIMPLFALANAGVTIRGGGGGSASITAGVALGLVIGKPLGILAASALSVRLGLCSLPRGVDWRGVCVVGVVGGIGFTMSIFIAGLAFTDPALLDAAKIGVLAASGAAGALGLLLGRVVLSGKPTPGAAVTVAEAERATDR